MHVWINGERREMPQGACVLDVLDALGVPRCGVAVAVDDAVVPRVRWPVHRLVDGVRVEVLTAVQGG